MSKVYSKKALFLSKNLATIIKQHNFGPELQDRICGMIDGYISQYNHYRKAGASPEQIIEAFYEAMDREEQHLSPELKFSIQCRKGCGFCCHINVDVSMMEAATIVKYCNENNIVIDYAKLATQPKRCIFLDEQNGCTVYPVRPLACRKHFVVSAPQLCDTVKYPNGQTRNYANTEMEIIASALYNIEEAYTHLGDAILKLKNKKG